MSRFEELELEKKKLRQLAEHQKSEIKNNFSLAKTETRRILWEKIVIPAGISLLVGFGAKKLFEWWQSDDENLPVDPMNTDHTPVMADHLVQEQHRTSVFGNVDWIGTFVRILPFALSVGKKLYDEGNLPFFGHPEEEKSEA